MRPFRCTPGPGTSGVPLPGVQLKRPFCLSIRIRASVGDPYGRDAGNPVLWESSETPGELAKAAALSERLPGMCGSVGHGEGLALNREG